MVVLSVLSFDVGWEGVFLAQRARRSGREGGGEPCGEFGHDERILGEGKGAGRGVFGNWGWVGI